MSTQNLILLTLMILSGSYLVHLNRRIELKLAELKYLLQRNTDEPTF